MTVVVLVLVAVVMVVVPFTLLVVPVIRVVESLSLRWWWR